MATCSDDGTLRLWTVASREQALQFQVLEQVCALSADIVKITSNIQSNAFISCCVIKYLLSKHLFKTFLSICHFPFVLRYQIFRFVSFFLYLKDR